MDVFDVEKGRYFGLRKIIRNIVFVTLICVCVLASFTACGNNGGDAVKLSFKSASGYDYLKTLDGKQVTINGYIATSSPVDGSFIFLMNLPYQSCPFCVPNTSELSNTIEVYPAKGENFASFTAQAIKVVGTLVVAENKDEPFTDEYGYTFNYKIVDATYTVIKAEDLSSNMALWQKIAEAGVVDDVYAMYDYLNFVCSWYKYRVNDGINADGERVPGFYISPEKIDIFLFADGAQFNYGYKDGYFDGIVKKIESVDKEAFSDLVKNVRSAEKLAEKALAELEAGNYTSKVEYDEDYGREMEKYILNRAEELSGEWQKLYYAFAGWIGSWEL